MAQQTINIGTVANDGTGDDLRVAMQKVNENFTEVYAGTLAATTLEFTDNNIISTGTNDAIVFAPNGTGTIDFPAIRIDDNNIVGLRSNENLNIVPAGTGSITLDASTDITGVLGVTGATTLSSLTFGSGATITSILDEDTMNSDSATAVPTQQSVKAYVDSQIVATNSLRVADDSSTVVTIDLDGTLSVVGATGITTAVSGSTLTITGPDLSSYITNSPLTVVGDDSTGTVFNTGETVKIAGGTNITTAVSGDTLTIEGATSIVANSIESADSTAIQINDGVNISGVLSADNIETNIISSTDSSAVTIGNNLNISGTLAANIIDTNIISSNDSTVININDGLLITGSLQVNGSLGFFGTTPVSQQSAIAFDPLANDGSTVDDLRQIINQMLIVMRNYGLIAS